MEILAGVTVPLLEAAIFVTTLLTSALSGVLGMGGGLILMGVMALLLPAGAAMALHGLAQLTANGSRALVQRRHIAWRTLPPYLAGAAVAMGLFAGLSLTTETWIIQLGLGALPFLALSKGRAGPTGLLSRLDIQRRSHGAVCGLLVTGLQLLAGASGPLLDVFYLKTKLTRHQIVATKALTQTVGHSLKLVYYGSALAGPSWITTGSTGASLQGGAVPLALLVTAAAVAGTLAGSRWLERLSDERFQIISRRVILVIGGVYLLQGAAGLAATYLPS